MTVAALALLLFAAPPQKGILTDREPGRVVSLTPTPGEKDKVDVVLDGRTLRGVLSSMVIPFDPVFAPSRIYLMLTAESWPEKTRCGVAQTAVRYFPRHPLYDDIFLVDLECVERAASDDKSPPAAARRMVEDYLKRHPNGKLRDRFEWQLVQWDNYVYEYEGEADFPIREARAYERFLAAHPATTVADDIRLKLGYLYRVIHECLDRPEKPDRAWREKARQMYEQLLQSPDTIVREKARVALYNLARNHRVYSSPDDW